MSTWFYDISPDRRQALIVDDEGFTVAEIAGHTDMTETVELMTAAPDLLDALQRLMRHIPSHGGASFSDDLSKARAAITKATYTAKLPSKPAERRNRGQMALEGL